MMPGITGHELLINIKKIDATAEVIVMTGYGTIDSAVSSIREGAYDYIVKPFKMEALCHVLDKARAHRDLIRENRRLQENSLNVLRAMVNVLEQRDTYTAGHSQRVTEIAMSIGRGLELPEGDIKVLRLAGPIHDIGKIGIEDNILRKPGPLTKEEYEVIKSHPEKGRQIIEPLDFLRETIPIIPFSTTGLGPRHCRHSLRSSKSSRQAPDPGGDVSGGASGRGASGTGRGSR